MKAIIPLRHRYWVRNLIQELVNQINKNLEHIQEYNGITKSECQIAKLESYKLNEISKQPSIVFDDLVEPKIRI